MAQTNICPAINISGQQPWAPLCQLHFLIYVKHLLCQVRIDGICQGAQYPENGNYWQIWIPEVCLTGTRNGNAVCVTAV